MAGSVGGDQQDALARRDEAISRQGNDAVGSEGSQPDNGIFGDAIGDAGEFADFRERLCLPAWGLFYLGSQGRRNCAEQRSARNAGTHSSPAWQIASKGRGAITDRGRYVRRCGSRLLVPGLPAGSVPAYPYT